MKKYKKYIGILLGTVYGLMYRFVSEFKFVSNYDLFDFNIYSISFIWVLPICIGIIPILVAQDEMLKNDYKQFFYPILSVFIFFIIAIVNRFRRLVMFVDFRNSILFNGRNYRNNCRIYS